MKLIVFCLLAVCCYSMATRTTTDRELQRKKLVEVLRQMAPVKNNVEKSLMLRTPPKDIEDCCSLAALDCFQESLKEQFNIKGLMGRLHRSLKNNLTRAAMDFCGSRNDQPTCQACASHPRTNASEFFTRLEALLQKGIAMISN